MVGPQGTHPPPEEGAWAFPPGASSLASPHPGLLLLMQAPERPLVGVNGLDVSSLRPFDLVIPFTIKKGEITGACGLRWAWEARVGLQAALILRPGPSGEVRMPSGKVAQPAITDNKDGTVTVRYAPSEAGLHEMDIRYDNMHIPGVPSAKPGGEGQGS